MASSSRRVFVSLILLIPMLPAACASSPPAAALRPGSSSAGTLAQQLDRALSRGQTGPAHYTARVIDLSNGRELYAVDADIPYMPASNGKLAVGAATLDFFGPDRMLKTYLALDGPPDHQDLWLIGTGDPGIGDSLLAKKAGGTTMTVLDDFADALKKRGVKEIRGNLYYYDRAFDDQWTHPTWRKSYLTDWYAAPISGLNFNNNCIDVSVKPTTAGQLVTYTVIPPTRNIKIENHCITAPPTPGLATSVASASTTRPAQGDEPEVTRKLDADEFTIKGATTKPVTIKSEAVTNPGAFFADALRTHLQEKGISIAGETRRADHPLGATASFSRGPWTAGSDAPTPGKTIAVHETKLADALKRINKQSQNNFAEGFCKLLGKGYREKQGRPEPGSWSAGSEAARAFLTRNGIDVSKIAIIDGSGLSRENRVTSRMISDLLRVMWKHRDHQAWFDSMGIAGEDGTIAKRMLDLKGRVHAKTGFIGGVRALSGYIKNDDGRTLAFSIIYNGFEGPAKPYEDRQDNACRILAAWPKHVDLPAPAPTTRPTTRPSTSLTPTTTASAAAVTGRN